MIHEYKNDKISRGFITFFCVAYALNSILLGLKGDFAGAFDCYMVVVFSANVIYLLNKEK